MSLLEMISVIHHSQVMRTGSAPELGSRQLSHTSAFENLGLRMLAEFSPPGTAPSPTSRYEGLRSEVGRRGKREGEGCLPRGAPVGRGLGRG